MSAPTDTVITVLTTERPTGKTYRLQDDKLHKTTSAAWATGSAIGHPIATAEEMAVLLADVTRDSDRVLVPGHFINNDDERPFEIITRADLCKALDLPDDADPPPGISDVAGRRLTARLKENIEPCAWILMDGDNPEGMPAHFATLDIGQRLERLETVVPGLSRCARIEARSSSARIVAPGGTPGPYSHAWIRVTPVNLIEKLRLHVRIEAPLAGLGFQSPRRSRSTGDVIGHAWLTLVDASVWTRGRIVFCAAPTITDEMYSAGWSVADAGVRIVNPNGGALDLRGLRKPTRGRLDDYENRTGERLTVSGGGSALTVKVHGVLTLDTPIETDHAPVKTMREALHWLRSRPGYFRLRCQTPLRDSESEAAFVRWTGPNLSGFLYDSGTSTTYHVDDDDPAPHGGGFTADGGKSIAVVTDILDSHADWRGVLTFDRFSLRVILQKPIPSTIGNDDEPCPRPMRDVDVTRALTWFHARHMLDVRPNALLAAMVAVAERHGFHPVLDYFARVCARPAPAEVPCVINAARLNPDLPNDATALDLWLTYGFGADDNDLNRAIARKFLIAVVRRVRQPGCQHDHMPVLIGDQGKFKSTGLRTLIGNDWFADNMPPIGTKDAALQLHGKLVIELAEVESLTEQHKRFISSPIDRFRAPYGKVSEDHPRTCSFVGTTNFEEINADASGGRRYWPVFIGNGDRDWLRANRDLVWRLACEADATGETAWIDDAKLAPFLRERQRAVQRSDPWQQRIVDKAHDRLKAAPGEGVTIDGSFIFDATGLAVEYQHNGHQQRAADCLRRAEWRKGRGRKFRYRWFPDGDPHLNDESRENIDGEQV